MAEVVNQGANLLVAVLGGSFATVVAVALPAIDDWGFGDAGAFAFACGVTARLTGLVVKFIAGKVQDPDTGQPEWRFNDARWGEYGALAGGAFGILAALR